MDLSHQSITGRQFELNRRGYDPDTVDAHLAEIAAAVADREREVAELHSTIESLQAKVRDADESEEALRLTLKAAAHAKEELLAGAREQAKVMEQEAAARAETMVTAATATVEELTQAAHGRVQAMEDGARAHAGDVAQAALTESELLVGRIEGMRESLSAAERAVAALHSTASPQMEEARAALETALATARDVAEDPAVLGQLGDTAPPGAVSHDPSSPAEGPAEIQERPPEAAATPAVDENVQSAAVQQESDQPVPSEHIGSESEAVAEKAPSEQGADPAVAHKVAGEAAHAAEDVVGSVADEKPPAGDEQLPADGEQEPTAPHLEVVGPPGAEDSEESSGDISDKVDRLLEELREVT